MAMAKKKRKALSLFTDKTKELARRKRREVATSSGNRTRGGQVVRTSAQQKKFDNIIDGDFTEIIPKKGMTKMQIAAILTGGSITTLAALNALSPKEAKALTEDTTGTTGTTKKETSAEEAARLAREAAAAKAAAKAKAAAAVKKKTTTTTTTTGTAKKDDRVLPGVRPFGGVLAKVLLGKDEKFGGKKGLIDFLRPSKWGKGKKPATKNPVKKNMGGMANKASANKSSTRGKPRGVGAATRGYGKAMR
tara:strand:- start:582 stop:1328 length:747 start_codon:yes stop_codon:yes gene_type:complete